MSSNKQKSEAFEWLREFALSEIHGNHHAAILLEEIVNLNKTLVDSCAHTMTAAFKKMGDEIHEHKITHGWKVTGPDDWTNSQHEVPACLMLITTEVAEAMEAFRHDDRENFNEELADIVLRVVGLAHGLQIDLAQAIIDKMEKNKTREYKHGGKRL